MAGRRGRHRSRELQARMIGYAGRSYNESSSPKQVSNELAVNVHRLGFWRDRKANAKTLRPIAHVMDESRDAGIVLRVRNGMLVAV